MFWIWFRWKEFEVHDPTACFKRFRRRCFCRLRILLWRHLLDVKISAEKRLELGLRTVIMVIISWKFGYHKGLQQKLNHFFGQFWQVCSTWLNYFNTTVDASGKVALPREDWATVIGDALLLDVFQTFDAADALLQTSNGTVGIRLPVELQCSLPRHFLVFSLSASMDTRNWGN